jgi:hypothetical protein
MASGYTNRTLSARYPTDLPAWQALKSHYRDEMGHRELRDLFRRHSKRADRMTLTAGDLVLDYSKNHVNAKTMKLLSRLAKEADVPAAIEAMFAGERINQTEGRAVLHAALRSKLSDKIGLETPGVAEVWETLTAIEEFVEAVHSGRFRGHTGKTFSDVVNIGIGASAARTSARSWRVAHSGRSGARACDSTASRTSTARSLPISCRNSIRNVRCSSFAPRRSRRSKR